MKTVFIKPENWVLIIPLLFAIIEMLINKNATLDIHLHDTYFVIANVHLWFFFLLVNILPFACHVLLQHKKTKNIKLLFIHATITVVCNVALFLIFKINTSVPKRYYDFAEMQSYSQPGAAYKYAVLLILVLLLIHVLLIIYTLYILVKKPKVEG